MTLGRERAFRERLLSLAHLKPDESVLDVGCGTGTLAIEARRHVGPTGDVTAIDASPEMPARAEKKGEQGWCRGPLQASSGASLAVSG